MKTNRPGYKLFRTATKMFLVAGAVFVGLQALALTPAEVKALQQIRQLQKVSQSRPFNVAENGDSRIERLRALQRARQASENEQTAAAAPTIPTSPRLPQELPADSPKRVVEPASVPGETASDAIDEAAFRQMLRTTLPLTPLHIKRLRKAYLENKKAVETPPEPPPKPVATTQFLNLAPGATPPVIRLAKGFVSSLVFIDDTGAPWPIESYDIGNPSAFNIQWNKKSNTLMVQASKLYTYGNMAVKLWELNTPIMLTLVPGQKSVDYRADLRVPARGPNAKRTVVTAAPDRANDELLSVLNGVPPASATEVSVSGGQAQAWIRDTTMFVRTRATLLSPGWVSSMRSGDGMNAYELSVSPRLLMSVRGKIIQYKVEGL